MRFTREAKTLASLNHPNIAAIHGIENGALVMELVEGEDLSAHIARGRLIVAPNGTMIFGYDRSRTELYVIRGLR